MGIGIGIGIGAAVLVIILFVIMINKLSATADNGALRLINLDMVAETGIEASGKIIAFADDDIRRGPLHLVKMRIEITIPGQIPYIVHKQSPVAQDNYWEVQTRNISKLKKDAIFPMKVNQENKDWYFFVFEVEDNESSKKISN